MFSLRPRCPLSFLTSELAFADTQETIQFLHSISADHFIDPTPAEAAAAATTAATAGAASLSPFVKKPSGFKPVTTPGRAAAGSGGGAAGTTKTMPNGSDQQKQMDAVKMWDPKMAIPFLLAAAAKHKKVDVSRCLVDGSRQDAQWTYD